MPEPGAAQAYDCPVGKSQNGTGQVACKVAPAGSFVAFPGAAAAELCPVGTYQPLENQAECLAAPIGTYVDDVGAEEATACPVGTTTIGEGSDSVDDCLATTELLSMAVEDAVGNGGLVPAGNGRGASQQFEGWLSDLDRSIGFLYGPQHQAGCVGLRNAYRLADGQPSPKDKVAGPDREAIAAQIMAVYEVSCS